MPDTPFPLGRIHQPDPRNDAYPVSLLLDRTPDTSAVVGSSIHRCGLHLDQGDVGSCTGNGPTHWRACTPHNVNGLTEKDALALYHDNTVVDGFPGTYPPDDTGSSVLAAMKSLQKSGLIAGYVWAKTIDEVVQAVLHVGAAVAGTSWDDPMFTPDENYFVHPDASQEAGGHCYCIRGVTLRGRIGGLVTDYLTVRNSWKNADGTWWGHNSDFHITLDDFAGLMKRNGEVAIPHHVAALSSNPEVASGATPYTVPA